MPSRSAVLPLVVSLSTHERPADVAHTFDPELGRRSSELGRRSSELGRRSSELGRWSSGLGRRSSELGRQSSGLDRQSSGINRRVLSSIDGVPGEPIPSPSCSCHGPYCSRIPHEDSAPCFLSK